jgi:hypothetical protein
MQSNSRQKTAAGLRRRRGVGKKRSIVFISNIQVHNIIYKILEKKTRRRDNNDGQKKRTERAHQLG